jgi:hypothetical protein
MTAPFNQTNIIDDQVNNRDSMVDSVRILSDITRRDIEKSYNLDTIRGTEAYYSSRYGWTLRRTVD